MNWLRVPSQIPPLVPRPDKDMHSRTLLIPTWKALRVVLHQGMQELAQALPLISCWRDALLGLEVVHVQWDRLPIPEAARPSVAVKLAESFGNVDIAHICARVIHLQGYAVHVSNRVRRIAPTTHVSSGSV